MTASLQLPLKGADYLGIFWELKELLEPIAAEAGETLVKVIPFDLKVSDNRADYAWIAQSNKRFSLIFARPEKGKTYIALLKLEAVVQAPHKHGYRILLIDFDYGKRGNTWGSFPKECIIGAGEECEADSLKLEKTTAAINEFHRELERRSAECARSPKAQEDFEFWFLGIDEGKSVIPRLADETKSKLAELIVRGPGYNFSGFVIGQDAAVNFLGLPESIKKQFDKIAIRPDHVDQLTEFLKSGDAQPYVAASLEAEKRGERLAVWQSEYGTSTVYIPDRKDNPPRFKDERQSAQEWLDSLDQGWLSAILTSHDSPTAAFNAVMESWEDIKPEGAKKPKRTGQDPYWNAIKQRYEDLSK